MYYLCLYTTSSEIYPNRVIALCIQNTKVPILWQKKVTQHCTPKYTVLIPATSKIRMMLTKEKSRYPCKSTSTCKSFPPGNRNWVAQTELAKCITRILVVFSKKLSTVPNNLVPKQDSPVFREGGPCVSSSASEQHKGHLQHQTYITLLFSLFLSLLSQVAIPFANSLGDTKKIRHGTKPAYNPLQISSEAHTKKSKKILPKIFQAT